MNHVCHSMYKMKINKQNKRVKFEEEETEYMCYFNVSIHCLTNSDKTTD